MTIPTPSDLETFAFNLIKDQDQAKAIVEKVFGLLEKKEAIKTDADKRAFLYITVRSKLPTHGRADGMGFKN
jgi:predicted transcriptional regulator